jgi:MerR family transcriptional regulator, heat shock protein HspR
VTIDRIVPRLSVSRDIDFFYLGPIGVGKLSSYIFLMEPHEPGSPPAAGRGVYGISVAAELAGVTPQTLRLYERHALLQPERTGGGTRRYSQDDMTRLRRIGELVQAGVNLAGIARILELETANARLREESR